MINFTTLQGLTIPEGVVTQITDASGNVIWELITATDEPPAIFEVAKQTNSSYSGETQYTDNEFILFDIYPKKGGTVNVTYGGLTKTVKDTSGAEEPNAIQVFFGRFNGVSDSVATPASGTLTIEGAYRGYGLGSFGGSSGKSSGTYAHCVTSVLDFGNPVYIGARMFYNCADLTATSLPSGLTEIGNSAFYNCTKLALTSLPSGLTEIRDSTFYNCYALNISAFPEGLVKIGGYAFTMAVAYNVSTTVAMYGKTITFPSTIESIGNDAFISYARLNSETDYYTYLSNIVMLSTTPPTIDNLTFGSGRYGSTSSSFSDPCVITVPKGCGEAYKTAEGWTRYAGNIVEAS